MSKTRNAERLQWWQEARFGMFVHWGLYSQLGRHEWVMNREHIPVAEYEQLADTWKVKPRPAREWARLAKQAGMKYMVMTTKHHEGFCLWDSKMTDFNAVQRGPKRDLVAEFVEACREFDLRIGFYHSLMDWHHPDGELCAKDEAARRRFVDYIQGCALELCTNYGKIDIFWHDVSWPLSSPEAWESRKLNGMIRRLQPGILINNRAQTDEDFGTPEETVRAEKPGRAWEACMTFNGSWGYMPAAVDWHSERSVLSMLRTATAGNGNLLLNIGPTPDGSVPPEAVERLKPIGKWLQKNGEAVYGAVSRLDGALEAWQVTGAWTMKGNTAYYWCSRWPGVNPASSWRYVRGGKLKQSNAPGTELAFGGIKTKLLKASLLVSGKPVKFEQLDDRVILYGLPAKCPDAIAGMAVLKLEFQGQPRQVRGAGCSVE